MIDRVRGLLALGASIELKESFDGLSAGEQEILFPVLYRWAYKSKEGPEAIADLSVRLKAKKPSATDEEVRMSAAYNYLALEGMRHLYQEVDVVPSASSVLGLIRDVIVPENDDDSRAVVILGRLLHSNGGQIQPPKYPTD